MAKPHPSLTSDNRKGGLEEGQTSRNHEGSILWTITIQSEPTVTPAREEPIDASKKRYGTGPVYGSILEFAGGSVVQNAEMVASSMVAYNKKQRAMFNPEETLARSRETHQEAYMVYPVTHIVPPFPDRVQSCITKAYETKKPTDEHRWVPGSLRRIFPSPKIPVLRENWHRCVFFVVIKGGHQGVGEEVQSRRMKGGVKEDDALWFELNSSRATSYTYIRWAQHVFVLKGCTSSPRSCQQETQ